MDAMQGKASTVRYSGHYNTTDLIKTPPETRWANEGFHSGQGKKHIVYDDLSLTQWAVGQLSNIYQMKDAAVSKQALLQVILALKDATSLQWQAVRSAWATSMHEIEDGSLTWADATQWFPESPQCLANCNGQCKHSVEWCVTTTLSEENI